jgi:outer membrane lipoprotein SlyB
MNWKAGITALTGATIGGILGAVVQGARNRPMGDAGLVGASLGAIIGAALAPSASTTTSAPGTTS